MQLPLVSTFTRAFMVMLVAVLLPRRMREGRCTPGGDPSWPGNRDFSQYCYVGRYRTRYGGGGSETLPLPRTPALQRPLCGHQEPDATGAPHLPGRPWSVRPVLCYHLRRHGAYSLTREVGPRRRGEPRVAIRR